MATSFAPDRSRVPGPSTWLPGGAFWAFRKDPLAFFTNTARTYGDIAGFSFGPQKVYLVSRPEWVEDILVKSAGKFAKGVALERAKVLLGNGLLTAAGQEHREATAVVVASAGWITEATLGESGASELGGEDDQGVLE